MIGLPENIWTKGRECCQKIAQVASLLEQQAKVMRELDDVELESHKSQIAAVTKELVRFLDQ